MADWNIKKVDPLQIYELKDDVSLEQLNAMVESGLYSQNFAEHIADTPDVSDANNVGIPQVVFVDNIVDGKTYKKLKFINLKGERGATGDTGAKITETQFAGVDSAGGNIYRQIFDNGVTSTFTAPKGDKGEQGATGERGLTGASGLATGAVLSNEYGNSETNGYTQTYLNDVVSKPNLLIDGEFKVNTRGKSIYTYTGNWTDREYAIDMWSLYGIRGSTFNASTKTLTGQTWIMQAIEPKNLIQGLKYTLSVEFTTQDSNQKTLVFRITKLDGTKIMLGEKHFKTSGRYSTTFELPYTAEVTKYDVIFYQQAGSETILKNIKLEVGEFATPFIPKLYSEELRDCQFYYKAITGFKRAVSGYLFYEPYNSIGQMYKAPIVTFYPLTESNAILESDPSSIYNITSKEVLKINLSIYGYANKYGFITSNGDNTLIPNNQYQYIAYCDARIY